MGKKKETKDIEDFDTDELKEELEHRGFVVYDSIFALDDDFDISSCCSSDLISELHDRGYMVIDMNADCTPCEVDLSRRFKPVYIIPRIFSGYELREHLLDLTGSNSYIDNDELLVKIKELLSN